MQIAQIVYRLSFHILVFSAGIFLNVVRVHLHIHLRPVVDHAVQVKPFRLLLRVFRGYLAVAHHYVHYAPVKDGG